MDEQIIDLQHRLAHQEASIDALNATVARQHNELEQLRQEIERLKLLIRELSETQSVQLGDEPPPPHY